MYAEQRTCLMLFEIVYILTANACIVCNADTAKTVKCNGSHFASASGTVFIITIILGHWIRVIAVNVVRCFRILELSKTNRNALDVISSHFSRRRTFVCGGGRLLVRIANAS